MPADQRSKSASAPPGCEGCHVRIGDVPEKCSLLPVFDYQTRNTTEFHSVVGDQGKSMGQRDRGDHQVVGTNGSSLAGKMFSDLPVFFGRSVIKWQRYEALP